MALVGARGEAVLWVFFTLGEACWQHQRGLSSPKPCQRWQAVRWMDRNGLVQ